IFVAFLNSGDGVARGTEVSLEFQKDERLFFGVYYSISSSRGRASFPRSNQREVTDETLPPVPYTITPFDFDQTQRGSLLSSLRFNADDGEVLNGFECTALATFNSGRRFTSIEPIQNLGASSPWNIGARPLSDVRISFPTETNNASSTPWFLTVDLRVAKSVLIEPVEVQFSLNIMNLFNTRNTVNVYPQTGDARDDGWLQQPYSEPYKALPGYEQFYRAINRDNRWAYMSATGFDTFGSPRQIRFGITVGM
ncbi:MAG: TonB-dependent receptor, partial [Bacteroidetes bacterium]|nr:TonB-dependent receptor [Bacteroidota bacterium]